MDCLFCKIIDGQLESRIVYEDDDVLAILDLFPATVGHTLVMPKKHIVNCFDASENDAASLMAKATMLAKMLKTRLNATGMNVLINNEEIAGQVIGHLHIHLIPRYDGTENILATSQDAKDQLDETLIRITQN